MGDLHFKETTLKGVYIIDPKINIDKRGKFMRTFCAKEFAEQGLNTDFVQQSISINPIKGTLRGMHYQAEPYGEDKIVSCLKGSIYDVVLDLHSCKWVGYELSENNHRIIYIPKGYAHGFVTLTDDSVVQYQMSEYYRPESACGVRWNDRAFHIRWPILVRQISYRDTKYEDYKC